MMKVRPKAPWGHPTSPLESGYASCFETSPLQQAKYEFGPDGRVGDSRAVSDKWTAYGRARHCRGIFDTTLDKAFRYVTLWQVKNVSSHQSGRSPASQRGNEIVPLQRRKATS